MRGTSIFRFLAFTIRNAFLIKYPLETDRVFKVRLCEVQINLKDFLFENEITFLNVISLFVDFNFL